ncbi:MAG: sigma E protease regulator RseP [Gammaproteobacteria bacterium]|nr:sigma E protease regulator RseP [Gammaproteobacteria bacterium]
MLDTLLTIISFIVVLSLLIAVHEYGHFWVARKCGVKVIRFSIGFGQALWKRKGKVDDTEYVIAAIPLGGYVKMLDEREGEVDEADLERAFNRQPLHKRFAIVSAGPIANLLFAVFAYWLMFLNGVPGLKPFVGEVLPETPAAVAGLNSGDEIISVDGQATPTWQAVIEAVLPRAILGEQVPIQFQREQQSIDQVLDFTALNVNNIKPENLSKSTGLQPFRPKIKPVLDQVVAGSAAEKAGLLHGDQIIALDGVAVDNWQEFVESIQKSGGKEITVELLRDGGALSLKVTPTATIDKEGESYGKIGVSLLVDSELLNRYRAVWQFGPLEAMGEAIEKSWQIGSLTLKMIGEMIVGRASVDNLSGPISIARYAKTSADAGLSQLLGFIAVISISLGVLNLLPIPVLDGGHLFFYIIEWIKGGPLPEKVEIFGQQVGMALLLLLMSVAIYNDLVRL